VRLLAALAVLVGHAFVLTGQAPAPRVLGLPLHALGVAVFFAISGYLVAGSRDRTSSGIQFLRNRALRIFPGVIAVTLVTVFAIGPIASTSGIAAYFSRSETWAYLQAMILVPRYDLPGVFESGTHARTAVNGSLWTLGVEFFCYLLVLAVGFASRKNRPSLFAGMAAGGVTLAIACDGIPSVGGFASAAEMMVFFAVGALLSSVRVVLRASVALALFTAWIVASVVEPQWGMLLAWLALPYCVLTLAFASAPVLSWVEKIGDLSYGTYLWAYLVQQLVIDVAPHLSLIVSLAVTVACTIPLAAVSWWIIEKPALALKYQPVPGQGRTWALSQRIARRSEAKASARANSAQSR